MASLGGVRKASGRREEHFRGMISMNPRRPSTSHLDLEGQRPGDGGPRALYLREQRHSACTSEAWAGLRPGKQGFSASRETQPGLTSLWPIFFSPGKSHAPPPATLVEHRAEQIEWCCATSHESLCLFGPHFFSPINQRGWNLWDLK